MMNPNSPVAKFVAATAEARSAKNQVSNTFREALNIEVIDSGAMEITQIGTQTTILISLEQAAWLHDNIKRMLGLE